MKRTPLIALFVFFIALDVYAGPCRVLSWDAAGVTFEIDTGDPDVTILDETGSPRFGMITLKGFSPQYQEGRPILPARRFLFEVPSGEGVGMELLEVHTEPLDNLVPAAYLPGGGSFEEQREALGDPALASDREFLRYSGTVTYRRREIACVDCTPLIYDPVDGKLVHAKRILARLSFRPAVLRERPSGAYPLPDGVIVNAEQASLFEKRPMMRAHMQRTPFEFELSEYWLKLHISEKGIYRITYNDLLGAYINPLDVDPSTIRLFSGGPIGQPDSIVNGGSFQEDYHLTEHEILYRGSGAGSFSTEDTIIFYGIGVEGWADELGISGEWMERHSNLYETGNVYWLTWNGGFDGNPERMETRDVSLQIPPPSSYEVNTYNERLRVDKNSYYDPIQTDDRWYWINMGVEGISSFSDYFNLYNIASPNGRLFYLGYGDYDRSNLTNSARCYINGVLAGEVSWTVRNYSFNPDTLDVGISNLVNGENQFRVSKDADDHMYFLGYSLEYERYLTAASGRLDFFAPETAAVARFSMDGLAGGGVHLLDVTDHAGPVLLVGWESNGGIVRFEDELDAGLRHYAVSSGAGLRAPPRIELAGTPSDRLPSLRDDPVCPHMVIIHHERFEDAAAELAAHRESRLPGVNNPVVKAVDIEDVYNNFSGGLKDPIAIRNYLKFLYDNFDENGDPVIRYLLLMGNGTNDPKDYLGWGTDYVPLYINVHRLFGDDGIEDDDFLIKLDDSEDTIADLACGRMTVLSESESDAWVDRIITQEETNSPGTWKNKVTLVADDEYSKYWDRDFSFLNDSEDLADRENGVFPRFVDLDKIYLYNYDMDGNAKPDAQKALVQSWNEGSLIVNYIGHGSASNLADEHVFLQSDIFALTNGSRRPLFLAFSCTVSDLEEPNERSISQNLVTAEEGGAIASISAVTLSSPPPNTELNKWFFRYMFADRDSASTTPLGRALQLAKMNVYLIPDWRNNFRYVLLGDPAFSLPMPKLIVEHDISGVDTMHAGSHYTVNGSIKSGGAVLSSFNGSADILVEEAVEHMSEVVIREDVECNVEFDLPGKNIYRGQVDVSGGEFSFSFVVPLKCRKGPDARIRSYLYSSSVDGVGACDTLTITAADSIPENQDVPSVNMYFEGQATKVRPGAMLIIEISDEDGVAILGSSPQNSILLEFDGSGNYSFVQDDFTFDNGSYTKGRVEYRLSSNISPGQHSVLARAFDNLGASATDTLRFEVIEEGLSTVSDVFNFPNPFKDGTNFVFQLTGAADVNLSVYNVSGIRIWERRTSASEGFNCIYWDGRDYAGDRIANGTYLYVLDVEFMDSFHRKETVKGKAVSLR